MTRSLNRHLLDNIAIVLMHPKYPENIGAAARAAWNMGLTRIIIVADEYPNHERMAKMATHKAAPLLDSMEFHQDLGEALKPFSQIVATTARKGRQRILQHTPRDVMETILPLLPENQVAFLFGPEDSGLTNDDLKYCQLISAVPTADFSSLNLAQAVGIHCYEIYQAVVYSGKKVRSAPAIASSFELEGMYEHLENALLQVDFLQEKSHSYYMRNIRQLLSRIRLNSKEANIIRGICRQFLWHTSPSGNSSKRGGKKPQQ
ncbi:MAG: RNA methyltransferase [Proteobacteria bacterium]|nr:RNA methyltransferase [Pseudomonadota bacterium]MBU1056960.1 RNA methyltransferase [Pseudomonadota bacterium]